MYSVHSKILRAAGKKPNQKVSKMLHILTRVCINSELFTVKQERIPLNEDSPLLSRIIIFLEGEEIGKVSAQLYQSF
jgi:hypothetical protein